MSDEPKKPKAKRQRRSYADAHRQLASRVETAVRLLLRAKETNPDSITGSLLAVAIEELQGVEL